MNSRRSIANRALDEIQGHLSSGSVLSTVFDLCNRSRLICLQPRDAKFNSVMAVPNRELEALHLSEDAKNEDAMASSRHMSSGKDASDPSPEESEDDRDAALRAELQNVRDINHVISGVLDSLNRAKGNMEVC